MNKELKEVVDRIKIIDSHEHLMPEAVRQEYALDFSYLLPHYVTSDLVSAGMDPHMLESVRINMNRYRKHFSKQMHISRYLPPSNTSMDLHERWRALAPYWYEVQNTSYARQIDLLIRDIWGLDGLNDDTYEDLSVSIARSRDEGWYRHILNEMAGIQTSLVDVCSLDVDRELFHPVVRADHLFYIFSQKDVARIEEESGRAVSVLADLEALIENLIREAETEGAVALKNGLAYERTLHYENATRQEAEAAFNRLLHSGEGLTFGEVKPLQDYLMRTAVRSAVDCGLTVQIHTGLLEGNKNDIENSHPGKLLDLIMDFPMAKFDLLHAGYPYHHEWITLAKMFPNVYANMTWMYIISPSASKAILHELFEMVPQNKIIGFGGDAIIVEEVYAHAKIARTVLSNVLSEKIAQDYFGLPAAIKLAERVLRDNAINLYGLKIEPV